MNKTVIIYCNLDEKYRTPSKDEIIDALRQYELEVFRIQAMKPLRVRKK